MTHFTDRGTRSVNATTAAQDRGMTSYNSVAMNCKITTTKHMNKRSTLSGMSSDASGFGIVGKPNLGSKSS